MQLMVLKRAAQHVRASFPFFAHFRLRFHSIQVRLPHPAEPSFRRPKYQRPLNEASSPLSRPQLLDSNCTGVLGNE
jgi:hypothetical protein